VRLHVEGEETNGRRSVGINPDQRNDNDAMGHYWDTNQTHAAWGRRISARPTKTDHLSRAASFPNGSYWAKLGQQSYEVGNFYRHTDTGASSAADRGRFAALAHSAIFALLPAAGLRVV